MSQDHTNVSLFDICVDVSSKFLNIWWSVFFFWVFFHDSRCIRIPFKKSMPMDYPSFHKHGNQIWVPPIIVTFQIQPFSTSMIMGEKVFTYTLFWKMATFIFKNVWVTIPSPCSGIHTLLDLLCFGGLNKKTNKHNVDPGLINPMVV